MRWRAMQSSDLATAFALADQVHVLHPERREVFDERWRLYRAGCRVLAAAGDIGGYLLSHPWPLDAAPKLDTLLGALPAADSLYLHDIALAERCRGWGHAATALAFIEQLARDDGYRWLALIAVNGTERVWSRYGFVHRDTVDTASYGAGAAYMVKRLGGSAGAAA
jgi:GNAT superfamily N-acetyltransferase